MFCEQLQLWICQWEVFAEDLKDRIEVERILSWELETTAWLVGELRLALFLDKHPRSVLHYHLGEPVLLIFWFNTVSGPLFSRLPIFAKPPLPCVNFFMTEIMKTNLHFFLVDSCLIQHKTNIFQKMLVAFTTQD